MEQSILFDEALPLPLQILGPDGAVVSENAAYLSRFRRDDETEKLLATEKMDLNGLVQAAVDTVRPTADARRVSLDVRLEEGLAQTSLDPDRMQQVVLNLLVNAVKFTHQRGRVSVRTFAGAGEVGLSVSDTGKGIPSSFLPFVFEPFRQADASITRRHGGMGLGLAIVKHLVELHFGTVRVRPDVPCSLFPVPCSLRLSSGWTAYWDRTLNKGFYSARLTKSSPCLRR